MGLSLRPEASPLATNSRISSRVPDNEATFDQSYSMTRKPTTLKGILKGISVPVRRRIITVTYSLKAWRAPNS